MRARVAASSRGDGASSMTFWCRRCNEHSRSPRWIVVPARSARICTSMCRGVSINRSRRRVSSPNAEAATPPGRSERGGQLAGIPDHLHALAAAARGRLDQQRVPDLGRRRREGGVVEAGAGASRHRRHAASDHGLLGCDLVAHGLEGVHARSDEDDPRRRRSPARSRRSRTGSRSPGGSPARPRRPRHPAPRRCRDSRARGRRRRRATREARPHQRRCRWQPTGCRGRAGSASPGRRSRLGWRRATLENMGVTSGRARSGTREAASASTPTRPDPASGGCRRGR